MSDLARLCSWAFPKVMPTPQISWNGGATLRITYRTGALDFVFQALLPDWEPLKRFPANAKSFGFTKHNSVERVARAIAKTCGSTSWERLDFAAQHDFKKEARAAIEAMREPTEAMLAAAGALVTPAGTESGSWANQNPAPADAYIAMIDAALAGPDNG
jgi:hypothetical protein